MSLLAKEPLAQQSRDAADRNLREMNVILVLDNSGSMKSNDPGFLIKKAVSGFVEGLTENSRLAIVLFDTKAKIILKLTKVSQADFGGLLNEALDQIDYRGQRTDIPGGLELALAQLSSDATPGADSVVVFLTDGIVDLGSKAKNAERSRFLHENLLPEIKQKKIRVYGVALSKSADLQLVQNLSSETEGDYHPVMGASEILPAFQKINSRLNALMSEAGFEHEELDSTTETKQQEGIGGPETDVEEMQPIQAAGDKEESIGPSQKADPEAAEDNQFDENADFSESDTEGFQTTEEPVNEQPGADLGPQIPDGTEEPYYKRILSNWVAIGLSIAILGLALIAFILYRRRRGAGRKATVQESNLNAVLVDINVDADEEKTYSLGQSPIRIGRSKRTNDIVIDQSTVSSQHAIIDLRDGKYYLRDLGSTNGTYVNDRKVGKAGLANEVCLNNHDLISIARYKFRFSCKEPGKDAVSPDQTGFGDRTVVTPTVMVVGREKSLDKTLMGYKPSMCPNHPVKVSNEVCTACKRTFCSQCMDEQNGQWLCSECRERLA